MMLYLSPKAIHDQTETYNLVLGSSLSEGMITLNIYKAFSLI